MKKFVIIGVLLIFVLFSGCVSESSVEKTQNSNLSSSSNSDSLPKAQTETQKFIDNGEVGKTYDVSYRDNKYQVILSEKENVSSSSSYFPGDYVMVFFEIKNNSDTEVTISPNLYLIDSSGEKYDNTFVALGVDDKKYTKTLSLFKQLPPGAKTSGWVVFKAPEDKSSYDVYFDYGNYFDKAQLYIKYHFSNSDNDTPIDIPKVDASQISKETALNMCNKKATDCSEGVPAIETELKLGCWQMYYYTGDSNQVLTYANKMCE